MKNLMMILLVMMTTTIFANPGISPRGTYIIQSTVLAGSMSFNGKTVQIQNSNQTIMRSSMIQFRPAGKGLYSIHFIGSKNAKLAVAQGGRTVTVIPGNVQNVRPNYLALWKIVPIKGGAYKIVNAGNRKTLVALQSGQMVLIPYNLPGRYMNTWKLKMVQPGKPNYPTPPSDGIFMPFPGKIQPGYPGNTKVRPRPRQNGNPYSPRTTTNPNRPKPKTQPVNPSPKRPILKPNSNLDYN